MNGTVPEMPKHVSQLQDDSPIPPHVLPIIYTENLASAVDYLLMSEG
jgi:hypothetical protein